MDYRFDAYYQSMPFQGEIADELRALANASLLYDTDAYARERKHKVLELSARLP